MTDAPGPETVECQSCGSAIRKHAKICHQCGSENELKPGRSKREKGVLDSLPSVSVLRPEPPKNVTDQWFYGVIACLFIWVLVFGLAGANLGGALTGLLLIAVWVGLPASVYYDSHYVRTNSDWNPVAVLWCLGATVPLLNIPVIGLYLLRRRDNVRS